MVNNGDLKLYCHAFVTDAHFWLSRSEKFSCFSFPFPFLWKMIKSYTSRWVESKKTCGMTIKFVSWKLSTFRSVCPTKCIYGYLIFCLSVVWVHSDHGGKKKKINIIRHYSDDMRVSSYTLMDLWYSLMLLISWNVTYFRPVEVLKDGQGMGDTLSRRISCSLFVAVFITFESLDNVDMSALVWSVLLEWWSFPAHDSPDHLKMHRWIMCEWCCWQ